MPAPAEPRARGVIVFDGVCGLCNGFITFVIAHDRSQAFTIAPLQSRVGRDLVSRFRIAAPAGETVVVIIDDRAFTRSSAVLQVMRRLPQPWRSLAALEIIPTRIRDLVYAVISRHRYSFFGRRDTCRVPGPEERERWVSAADE